MTTAINAELAALAARVRDADERGLRLRLRGAGTKDFYGQSLEGEVFDTSVYRGIVAYEPSELVVTARCGTPISDVEAALAEHNQMLAFEPPTFGGRATVGGLFSAGLSGPRRVSAGSARDFALGASIIDATGCVKSFGGQVMKNVAGYDVSRLLCGALGILGVVAEVSLKVLPRPSAEVTVAITLGEAEALALMNTWAGKPLPISATAWHSGGLRVRYSGASAAVAAAVRDAAAQHGAIDIAPDVAQRYWAGLREQTDEFFEGDEPLWRLSLPSVAPLVTLPGRQLIEWGGALRWLRSSALAHDVRAVVQAAGGTAALYRGGDKSAGVFHPLSPAVMGVHRRLKQEFDPKGIFNPGRMYAGL